MALIVEDGTDLAFMMAKVAVEDLKSMAIMMCAEHAVHRMMREQFPGLEVPPPATPEEVARRWQEKWLCP